MFSPAAAATTPSRRQSSRVTTVSCRSPSTFCARFAAAAGENTFTYGRLHALEQARAERAEQEFWDRVPKLRTALRAR